MWEQERSDNQTDTDMPPVIAALLWTITDQAAVTCSQSNTPLGARADRFVTNAHVGQCMTCAGWPVSALEFAESKTVCRVCWVKDQRHTQSKPTGAPLWTVPRWAGTHCLSLGIKLLTTLDYFASQRCGFEALYENTPNPHWIFRTIQYVLISSPIPLAVHSRGNNMLPAIAESYFKSF